MEVKNIRREFAFCLEQLAYDLKVSNESINADIPTDLDIKVAEFLLSMSKGDKGLSRIIRFLETEKELPRPRPKLQLLKSQPTESTT